MKAYWIAGALAALPAVALAQETDWKFYEPDGAPMQAILIAAGGEQFIMKCDKPGKQKVYAVLVNNSEIAAPSSDDKYESRPVRVRMDDGSPWEDNWRYNGKFAMAVDKGTTRSMTRVVEKLVNANSMEVRLEPLRKAPVVLRFDSKGARQAVDLVYESCKDTPPA